MEKTRNVFESLNSLLTKEDVVSILRAYGFEAYANRNFRLREDDKNPSASIFIHRESKIPMIKDFGGGGFTGDIFKTLKTFANVPYKESVEYVKKYLNLSDSDVIPKKVSFKEIKDEKKTLSASEIEKKWNRLYPLTSLGEKMKDEISKLVPYEFFLKAEKEDKELFLERVRYSSIIDDVAVKGVTPSGEILTFKFRRTKDRYGNVVKWKALKGTRANYYSQIRIKDYSKPVFIVEGYHDYSSAILLGINFIAIPFKHYEKFKEEELELFKGKKFEFVLIQDYDFDEEDEKKRRRKILESKKQERAIKKALSPFASKFVVWKDIRAIFKDLRNSDKIKDLSDVIAYFNAKDPYFLRQRLFYEAKKKEKVFLKNPRLLTKEKDLSI